MSKLFLVDILTWLEPTACIAAFILMGYRKQIGQFGFLAAYLATRSIALAVLLPIIELSHVARGRGIDAHLAYQIYFYTYWLSYATEAIFGFGIVYSLYRQAMQPLPGLQRLGTIMFRWVFGIALVLAITAACGPHIDSTLFIIKFVTELQQTQSVLTLCMLLFVTLASKPMGISHRSKLFGISLGLGLLAATDLVASGWLSRFTDMSSIYNVINGIAICLTLGIWITYFAMPEPKRRMIVLPTTSPFLRWNQISQALGDEPGFVTVGQVTPEMFAPAEIEVMLRASAKIDPGRASVQHISALG